MNKTLSSLARIAVLAMLIAGLGATLGQILGLAIGNGELVVWIGDNTLGPIAALGGLAAIFAFLQLYTAEGKKEVEDANIDTDEAGA